MDIILLLKALVLGIVEGVTEFLPISSTGHLIVVGDLLNYNDEQSKVFKIVIQLGAILAVCWDFRKRIGTVIGGLRTDPVQQHFAMLIFVGFLPAMLLGFSFYSLIKQYLFNPITVAGALIVGGFVILYIEKRAYQPRYEKVEDMSSREALLIGFAQSVAMFPGVSRAGATIMGGLTNGNGSGNRLVLTSTGLVNLVGVSGFETFQLASGGRNSLTLKDTNFARVPSGWINIIGGGSGDTVDATAFSAYKSLAVIGNSETIFMAANNTLSLYGGSGHEVYATNDVIGVTAGTSLNIIGANDVVYLGVNATLGLYGGSGYSVYATSDVIGVTAGTSFSLVGSNDDVYLGANASLSLLGGSGCIIHGTSASIGTAAGMAFVLTGQNNAINVGGSGDTIGLVNGFGDVVTGSSAQLLNTSITGFGTGMGIDFNDLVPGTSAFSLVYKGDTTQGVLSIVSGSQATQLQLVGNYTASLFHTASDGHGGTLVSYG